MRAKYNYWDMCPDCDGSGSAWGGKGTNDEDGFCKKCDGYGKVGETVPVQSIMWEDK